MTTSWLGEKIGGTESTPARVLGTAFQPSADKPVLGFYTIQTICAHGNDGTVTLLSDTANPPTTARAIARAALSDDAASMTVTQQLTYLVPPGHYVKLVAAGTGTPSISAQAEIVLT